jgi:hypothetical protein
VRLIALRLSVPAAALVVLVAAAEAGLAVRVLALMQR